jgi:hypothetical protein
VAIERVELGPASAWRMARRVGASPRRNVLAVGQGGATFLSHVISIAAEVAHGLSDRAA